MITAHAIMRFQERVENIPAPDVVTALSSPAIQTALKFGAPFVRLGTGQRIVIVGGNIVTVLPAMARGRLDPNRIIGGNEQ